MNLLNATVIIFLSSTACIFSQDLPGDLEDVLLTDAYSDIDRRESLAPARTNDAPPATWWQSGYVRTDDGWASYEDVIRTSRTLESQTEYNRLQAIAPAGAKGHVLLAKWCLRNDRPDQYRAHMMAAIETDPSLLSAKQLRRMGFANVGGRWLSPEAQYNLVKGRLAIDRSLANWGNACGKIRSSLNGTAEQRTEAEYQLGRIESPNAIPALDFALGTGDARCHHLAVDAFSRIESVASSQTLAKYAVFSPSATVREEAIQALANRRKEDFVPGLLDLLATETTVDFSDASLPVNLGSGYAGQYTGTRLRELAFHIKVQRETRRHTHTLLDSETRVRFEMFAGRDRSQADFRYMGARTTLSGLNKLSKLHEAKDLHSRRLYAAVQQTGRMNVDTFERNSRVFPVLHAISDETSTAPEFWWKWWDNYADVDTPTKVEVAEVALGPVRERRQFTFTVASSCFIAGTPVLTETGRRPVETLRVGDKVLSQDIDTGELRFRVVERTTVRAAKPTIAIHFDSGETVRCTGGHNFWKAGEGWVKARDLEASNRIRTPTGTTAVTATTEARPAKTYNLVVEGFHTYFVGESALLVQDVLPLTPTDMVLPGLSRFELDDE